MKRTWIVAVLVASSAVAGGCSLGGESDKAGGERRPEAIVLDLRQVSFLDSTAIRLVVQLARDLGRAFSVVRGSGEVARVFDLVGLDGRVRMLDSPPGE